MNFRFTYQCETCGHLHPFLVHHSEVVKMFKKWDYTITPYP
jgi:hypothetical protein